MGSIVFRNGMVGKTASLALHEPRLKGSNLRKTSQNIKTPKEKGGLNPPEPACTRWQTLCNKIDSIGSWYFSLPCLSQALIGTGGAILCGMTLRLGVDYFYEPPLPESCLPGIDPECSGPQIFKKISLGIIEDSKGDFGRISMVEKVNANHAEYAAKWGYEHNIVSENLVLGKCEDPVSRAPVDCVPYWNKIEMFRQWLAEPKIEGRIEEWRVFFDSDMVVTNYQIRLEDVIDRLRQENESVIVTRDGLNWQKGLFSKQKFAVNTGILLVRKDQAAKELFDEIWNRRNDLVLTRDLTLETLGTCASQQTCLHEQEALSDLLHAKPFLADKVISIAQSRDASSPRRGAIALNTYERSGDWCFLGKEDGLVRRFTVHAQRDPESLWREGDFTGQVPALPIWGKELSFENGECKGNWDDVPWKEIRKSRVEHMINHTIK